MKKITAREIQVFVAGALAIWGFDLLAGLPSDIFNIYNEEWIGRSIGLINGLFGGFVLWLGVAILLGRIQAIRWAQIYLWLKIVFNLGLIIIVFAHAYFASRKPEYVDYFASDTIGCIVLLRLIFWSHSGRFQEKSEGQITN